jgi:galactokinase/galacturonokinase
MAIDRCVLLAFVPRADDRVIAESLNYEGRVTCRLSDIPPARRGDWGNYARGAGRALHRYRPETGIDALVEGNSPVGGLSSSAALGLAFLLALEHANGLAIRPVENVELDRYIENTYLGLQNGILDQSVILRSRPDRLLYLDCGSSEVDWIPTPANRTKYDILVVYSGLERSLMQTDYNKRVAECCRAAATMLAAAGRETPGTPKLRLVPEARYDALAAALEPPLDRRARHFSTEMKRVRQGVAAWRAGDLHLLGKLIVQSGASSIEDYECGSPHLIDLYRVLAECPGVYGARFAGGGFRGCCVGLSDPGYREDIQAAVRSRYVAAHPDVGGACQVFFAQSGGPARLLAGP